MDFHYDDAVRGSHAWGVHRGTLFGLLWDAVTKAGIAVAAGVEVAGLRAGVDGWRLRTPQGERGPYDVVIGADGARSRLRHLSGTHRAEAKGEPRRSRRKRARSTRPDDGT